MPPVCPTLRLSWGRSARNRRAVSFSLLLCGSQWVNSINLLLYSTGCLPKIHRTLRIEPKLGSVSKQAGEPKSHFGTHSSPFTEQLVNGLARYADGLGKGGYAQ